LIDPRWCVRAALGVTADAAGFSPSLIVQEETVLVAQIELKWFLPIDGKV